jgi:LPXTG-motif cell wall-anchored protein
MNRHTLFTIGGVLAALALAFTLASTALAHAKLVKSDPAAGAKLAKAPERVTLTFSEEISDKPDESYFTVTDAKGTKVGAGTLDKNDLDRKTLAGTLNPGLGDGVYTVSWQTITPDDNGKSTGTFTFGVNADPGPQTDVAGKEAEEATATPTAAPKPTTAAGGGAAQPTAQPATPAAGGQPTNLPTTGGEERALGLFALVAAALALALGLLLRRRAARR